jgi:transposase
LANWIDGHLRVFEFYQGSVKLIVPDNPRTGVTRACRYEPDLNRTYYEMAQHYGAAIMPARPRKPRDKAKVESAVGVVQRWILAALRHRKFFSAAELNDAIGQLLDRLNSRRFRKRDATRASLFAEIDRPALQRSVSARWPTTRRSLHQRHGRTIPGRQAHCLTCSELRSLSAHDHFRSYAEAPPGTSGMDAIPIDPLG